MTQPELNFYRPGVTGQDIDALKALLSRAGWQTRADIRAALGWCDRKTRDTAESLGSEIVRGQRGFKLTSELQREDLSAAAQAADAALSQGKRMIRYGLALKRQLHAQIS